MAKKEKKSPEKEMAAKVEHDLPEIAKKYHIQISYPYGYFPDDVDKIIKDFEFTISTKDNKISDIIAKNAVKIDEITAAKDKEIEELNKFLKIANMREEKNKEEIEQLKKDCDNLRAQVFELNLGISSLELKEPTVAEAENMTGKINNIIKPTITDSDANKSLSKLKVVKGTNLSVPKNDDEEKSKVSGSNSLLKRINQPKKDKGE